MSLNYPLIFQPLFQQYLWGGRRLGTVLNKPIGETGIYAESWDVVDHGEHQSVVLNGPLKGKTLQQLVADFPKELFGQKEVQDRFPLLFKYLDAQKDLSVQVHPNDQQAAKLNPPDLGKTEAWLVLDTVPGAKLYAGLKPGISQQDLIAATKSGTTAEVLNAMEPKVGDCLFIPAGTIHALGAGLMIAEIQQASNTTFRLFDWNRVDDQGNSRPLHIEQSLETIEFEQGPVSMQIPKQKEAEVEQLVACEKFVWDRWKFSSDKTFSTQGGFHLISVVQGSVVIDHALIDSPLELGQTCLIPASVEQVQLLPQGQATMLDMYLP